MQTSVIARSLNELAVYRKSLAACAAVSELMERHGVRKDGELRTQLGSASAAIPANIAEGFGQQSDRQFARYLFIARGSSQEVRSHLAVAHSRKYIDEEELKEFTSKYEEIAKMLTGLIKHLRATDRKQRG